MTRRFFKKTLFTLLALAAVIFAGEIACRVKYFRLHGKDVFYMVTPLLKVSQTHKNEHGLFLPDSVADKYGVAVRDYPAWANTGYDRPCLDKMAYSACLDDYLPVSYNSFCWRAPEIAVEKPAGTVRIMVAGGSTMENVYLPDDDLATTHLNALLNDDKGLDKRFEVINTGHTAYDCARINQLLNTKMLIFNPDILLYVEAFNEQVEALAFFQVEQLMLALADKPLIGWLQKRLYLRSMLYTYLIEKYYYSRRENQIAYYQEEPSTECFIKTIGDCRAAGVEFIYVTQPVNLPLLAEDSADLNDEATLRRLADQYYARAKESPGDRALIAMVRGINQRLINRVQSDICRRMGVPVIELLAEFDQHRAAGENLFTDIIHRTCEGEKLLAGGIYEGLKRLWAGSDPAML